MLGGKYQFDDTIMSSLNFVGQEFFNSLYSELSSPPLLPSPYDYFQEEYLDIDEPLPEWIKFIMDILPLISGDCTSKIKI